jgi:hypothetical protein
MLFFFKEKPIEIIAFVREKHAYVNNFSPIVPAKKCLPAWWKQMPASHFDWESFDEKLYVRSCPGILNTLTSGYIVPLWCDIALEYNDKNSYRANVADKSLRVDIHDHSQSPGFYPDHYHFKLVSPWWFKTSVNLAFLPPLYHLNSPACYQTMPAIVPPIGEYSASHVFIFAKIMDSAKLFLKQNTPILHVVPMTDKKVIFRTEVADESQMSKIFSYTAADTHHVKAGLKQIKYLKSK